MARKGESLSEETKSKFRISLQDNLVNKYKWDLAEPFLDNSIKNGCSKRTNGFITLREFKRLIQSGHSLTDIVALNISKHLVQFFSIFCQGKISLTRDEFILEYESGKSLEEISKVHGLSRENVTYLRELFDIKRKGSSFIYRKATESPLTENQKAILYGSMLGDAKKMSPSIAAFVHGDKQKEYLLWKFEQFKSVVSEKSLSAKPYKDKRSGAEGMSWRFYTKANTDIETCIGTFYKNGIKDIYPEIFKYMNEVSLAVWFMDDGKTDFHYRSQYNNQPNSELCTESFSINGCNLLIKWLKDRFDLTSYLREKKLSNSTGYRIVFDVDNTQKLFKIICPFVIPSMMYKVNGDSYLQWRHTKYPMTNVKTGDDFNNLTHTEQDSIVDKYVEFYSKMNIESMVVYPSKLKEQMRKVFSYDAQKLLLSDCIGFCNVGNEFLMSHFPHFWTARAKGSLSPCDILKNTSYLSEIIRDIISEDAEIPRSRTVLRKLKRYRGNKSISGFMPCVAKAVYEKYCNNSKVIDFCSGYGGRLMGAMASDKVISYTGIDANFKSFRSANLLYSHLCNWANVNKTATLFNADSISGMKQFKDQTFDFCFTSPPYFDAEEYSEQDEQSSKKYTRYGEWFDDFLCKSVLEAKRISKVVAINIDNTGSYKIADDFDKFLHNNGLLQQKDYLKRPRYGKTAKKEPLFIIA